MPQFNGTVRIMTVAWTRKAVGHAVQDFVFYVPALPDRELLLILCLHGTKHFWSSLGWLVDVAELIRREGFASCEYLPVLGGLMAIHVARK